MIDISNDRERAPNPYSGFFFFFFELRPRRTNPHSQNFNFKIRSIFACVSTRRAWKKMRNETKQTKHTFLGGGGYNSIGPYMNALLYPCLE